MLRPLLILAAAARASAGEPAAAHQPEDCGPLSFGQMADMAKVAFAHVDALSGIKSKLLRSASAQLVCRSLDSSTASAPAQQLSSELCLGQAVASSLKSTCMKSGGCDQKLSMVKGTMASACDKLGGLGCQPALCARLNGAPGQPMALGASAPSSADALAGCFDVRSSESAAAVLRGVFPRSSAHRVASLSDCVAACEGSIDFAMEDGRCSCGEGVMGAWPSYKVRPSQCGDACPHDRYKAGLSALPCGLPGRVAVYRADPLRQAAASSTFAAERSHERVTMWSSALLAAAAVGTIAVSVGRRVARDRARSQALDLL